MKKIILSVIVLSFSIVLQAQQLLTKDQKKVQETVVKFFEVLSNRDSISLKSYATPDVSFYEYGEIWLIDTLIRKGITMNKAADFKRTNTFNFINTKTNKTMAWVTYRLSSEIFKDGKQVKIQWLETVILLKKKRIWRIKLLHSTLIKRN